MSKSLVAHFLIERALVLELERVKRHGGFSSSKTKSISRLEEHLAGIEADRDYWRNQVELLQQMLAHPSLAPRSNSTSRVSSRLKSKPPSGQTKTTSKAKETPLQHKVRLQTYLEHNKSDKNYIVKSIQWMPKFAARCPWHRIVSQYSCLCYPQ